MGSVNYKKNQEPQSIVNLVALDFFQGVIRGFIQNSKLPCNFKLTRRSCSFPPPHYALLWSRNAKTFFKRMVQLESLA